MQAYLLAKGEIVRDTLENRALFLGVILKIIQILYLGVQNLHIADNQPVLKEKANVVNQLERQQNLMKEAMKYLQR